MVSMLVVDIVPALKSPGSLPSNDVPDKQNSHSDVMPVCDRATLLLLVWVDAGADIPNDELCFKWRAGRNHWSYLADKEVPLDGLEAAESHSLRNSIRNSIEWRGDEFGARSWCEGECIAADS